MRLPITPKILNSLYISVNNIISSHYKSVLLKAMFALAFHAFLRVGEMTKSTSSNHVLQRQALSFSRKRSNKKRYVKLVMSNFKHQGSRAPVTYIIHAAKTNCPVHMLQKYCNLRGKSPGPLFCFPDLVPVSRNYFTAKLSSCIKSLGLSSDRYKGHSFRIGAATFAASKGYSDESIKRLGRWSSAAYKRYIRISSINCET